MSNREKYAPGSTTGATVEKDGEKWTLVLVRELRHPPAMVWQALTDPAHLSEWAPFDADRNLGTAGPVKLSTVGTPKPQISETVDSSRCAAGWHICFDVLDRLLAGEPLGRIVGPDAMKFGWPRLNAEYATQFGVEPPSWPSHSRS